MKQGSQPQHLRRKRLHIVMARMRAIALLRIKACGAIFQSSVILRPLYYQLDKQCVVRGAD